MAGAILNLVSQNLISAQTIASSGTGDPSVVFTLPPFSLLGFSEADLLVTVNQVNTWNSDSKLTIAMLPTMRDCDNTQWVYGAIEDLIGFVEVVAPTPNAFFTGRLGEVHALGAYAMPALLWQPGLQGVDLSLILTIDVVGRTAPGALVPYRVPGLQSWFRSDLGVDAPLGSVTAWKDLSTKRMRAEPTGGATTQPTLITNVVNGLSGVSFDGGDLLTTTTPLSLTSHTIFSVFSATGNGLVYEQGTDASTTDGTNLYTSTGNPPPSVQTRRGGTVTSRNNTANWGSSGALKIVRHDYDGTNAGQRLFINGAGASLTDVTAGNPGAAAVTSAITIGARSGGALFLTGIVMELIIFSPALPDALARRLEREYLSPRYGIPVT